MKYRLMVSYDAGYRYGEEATSDDWHDFEARCDELDEMGMRWVIEDENHKQVTERICAIFQGIFEFFDALAIAELAAKKEKGAK